MADSAKIEYSTSVIVSETLESTLDTSDTSTMIHSKVDKALGGSFNITPNTVAGLAIVTGLQTTDSSVDITFSDGTTGHVKDTFYDGLTAATETSVDFFFAKIESALSTGTPDCTFKFANQTNFQPKLYGVGDFCVIPMDSYNQNTGSYDVEVISSGPTTRCKITVMMVDRA